MARLTGTGRAEAFSDGVFAIVITLLIFNVQSPRSGPGELLDDLVRQWPAYLGYATSFIYVGVIWLNHHALFERISNIDKPLNIANLGLLLTTAFLPFPTAVLADALRADDDANLHIAIALYALVAGLMCASWQIIFAYLDGHPELLERGIEPDFFRREKIRALLGVAGYAIAGAIGPFAPELLPSLIFLVLPIFYGVTSHHGLTRGSAPTMN